MVRTALSVPPELARRRNRVIRPKDLADRYAHPRGEVARLTRASVLHRLATGYYALPPLNRLGDPTWIPDLNAVALGIGQADYGVDAVALTGVSAARVHGAIPRSVAVAVLAAPKQRPPLSIGAAKVVFTRRDVARLDVERTETELGAGWVTTVEQTVLDLAARPELGGLDAADVSEAIRALIPRADGPILESLAKVQRRPRALAVAQALAERASGA